ncbi:MAG: carboxypeptidase M32, partial [Synechococcaceae cyanobacterium]
LISAQLAQTLEAELGPIDERVANGEEAALRAWLAREVWPHGRGCDGAGLGRRVSGRPLSAEPFLNYLTAKLERLAEG